MKISFLQLGKTVSPDIKNICADYAKRINRYIKYEDIVIENGGIKSTDIEKVKEQEGQLLLKRINPGDYLFLLDERGKEMDSVQFAGVLNNLMNQSHKNICFAIGGAYGFSKDVYSRANAKLSLSKMTFSHQIIRAIFAEQLYRAFTILNNEPYHHS
ncbi:MAG: 23S rRNA (pseudouridine(1915)-N(3))-methyltransferase RlmH [Chitinophagales bacterium]